MSQGQFSSVKIPLRGIPSIHLLTGKTLENKYHRAYLHSFLLALLLCWSSSNALAYIAPFAVLTWFLFTTRSSTVFRNVLCCSLAWIFLILIHKLLTSGFVLSSAVLSTLTYSTFLLVFSIPNRWLNSTLLYESMLQWSGWVIVLEATLGIVQAMYGYTQTGSFDIANGDYVEGTIHPALPSEASFSNPIFSVGLALLLIAMLYRIFVQKTGHTVYLLGIIAFILASVLHVALFLFVAFAISIILFFPEFFRRKSGCLLVIFLTLSVLFAFFVLRSNFRTLSNFIRATVQLETPRALVVNRVLYEMPEEYPFMPLVGIGPGQFSSRAGLIGTGLYLGGTDNPVSLPLLPTGMSKPFETYVYDLWLDYSHRPGYKSSTVMPFFSWMSISVEFGVLTLSLIFVWVLGLLWVIKMKISTHTERIIAVSFGAGTLLILLLGIQENYWEIPQAILPGIMLLKVQYALLNQ